MLLAIEKRVAVVCERCKAPLVSSVVNHEAYAVISVLPCDHCIGQAELAATKEADNHIARLEKQQGLTRNPNGG